MVNKKVADCGPQPGICKLWNPCLSLICIILPPSKFSIIKHGIWNEASWICYSRSKHIQCGPCPLCRLIVRCHNLPGYDATRINCGNNGSRRQCSTPCSCLWRPTVFGMDGVEEMDVGQPDFVLLQNETTISNMGRRKSRQGGGVGSKRGCEATGLKWDFHLFIYLAELIAQGCLLAFCCMFCGLSAPSPSSECICKCKYVRVCMHINTSTTTCVFFQVCPRVSTVWVILCVCVS